MIREAKGIIFFQNVSSSKAGTYNPANNGSKQKQGYISMTLYCNGDYDLPQINHVYR